MAAELNETFMVRTSTPERNHNHSNAKINEVQTKLTQVQLKATLSNDENNQTTNQRSTVPSMDLVTLPKTQADVVVCIETLLYCSCHVCQKSITNLRFSFPMLSI